MELAVIGTEDFILGFKLVGIRKTYAVRDDEIEATIEDVMSADDVGIVVLHNTTLQKISNVTKQKILALIEPVVVTIGGEEEKDLSEKVRRVIGVDLYMGR